MTTPDSNVLEGALGKDYKLYEQFAEKINAKKLTLEWNYYNDGKSWLCKTLNKKKNMCWLSIWNTGFKLTFYFTEKTMPGVYNLEISDELMETAKEAKPAGKLLPIILSIKSKKNLNDGKLLEYKMTLK